MEELEHMPVGEARMLWSKMPAHCCLSAAADACVEFAGLDTVNYKQVLDDRHACSLYVNVVYALVAASCARSLPLELER